MAQCLAASTSMLQDSCCIKRLWGNNIGKFALAKLSVAKGFGGTLLFIVGQILILLSSLAQARLTL